MSDRLEWPAKGGLGARDGLDDEVSPSTMPPLDDNEAQRQMAVELVRQHYCCIITASAAIDLSSV